MLLEEDELEPMLDLLQMMYGFVKGHLEISMLLRVLKIADRYICTEAFITDLLCWLEDAGYAEEEAEEEAKEEGNPEIVSLIDNTCIMLLFGMGPRIASMPKFQDVAELFRSAVLRLYGNVPRMLMLMLGDAASGLLADFCALPFSAVLFWAGLDELEVHSENCVVMLLTCWVRRRGPCSVPAEDLKALGDQVRVARLGEAYRTFVLPSLEWFTGSSSSSSSRAGDLSVLAVFRNQVGVKQSSAWWKGPKKWIAKNRKRATGVAGVAGAATPGGVDIEWTFTTDGTTDVPDLLRTAPVYCNGYILTATLGLASPKKCVISFEICDAAMKTMGVELTDRFVTTVKLDNLTMMETDVYWNSNESVSPIMMGSATAYKVGRVRGTINNLKDVIDHMVDGKLIMTTKMGVDIDL